MQLVPCCVICCIALTTGADTEAKDKYWETPLMCACIQGHKDVATHLLEHGEPLHFFSCQQHAVLIFVCYKDESQNVYIV